MLFSNETIGQIEPAEDWTVEPRDWFSTEDKERKMRNDHCGYEILQGSGKVQGRLIGGNPAPDAACQRNFLAFPDIEDFTDSIIFLDRHDSLWQ